ncbi:MAG TPA: ethylbenzene dehydrogenase-related protein, partial [Acidiferrobacterales bacterium]|nr:ethylbenzene dehydrogenase-related protein [Acidiferrobacterales bacterium]
MYLTKRGPRSDAPTVVFHWLLVAALIVSLGSGLRVAADAVDARISKALSPLLMQGEVTYWHVLSASALCVLLLAYGVLLWRKNLSARLALDLRKLGSNNRTLRWTMVNRLLYWVAFGLLALAGVTGTLVYFAPGIVPMNTLLTVHRGAAWGFVGYVVVHVVAQAGLGGWRQLLKIVTPRAAYGSTAALALGLSAVAVAAVLYPLEHAMIRTLAVARVDQLPVIDGNPADRVWRQATPVAIHTAQGSNLPGGEVTVWVRAVHDGQRAAMLFEWPDNTRSQKHLPLVKTAGGWRVLQYRYGVQDEDTYYEDKLGVMLARSPRINGGGTSHLGPNPLPGRPGSPNARGLHFTDDGEFVDVWHWKSVRTGPLHQIDDNYFGPPKPVPKQPEQRYTGGYAQDPKDGGGFEQNWKK